MFSHDSKPFKLACFSLYGRTYINSDEEERAVIRVIRERRKFVDSNDGDYKATWIRAFGFTDPNEFMESDK